MEECNHLLVKGGYIHCQGRARLTWQAGRPVLECFNDAGDVFVKENEVE